MMKTSVDGRAKKTPECQMMKTPVDGGTKKTPIERRAKKTPERVK
jgi:hypothetical protein